MKFPIFYGTWRFITVLKRARHWTLTWATCLQVEVFWVVTLCNVENGGSMELWNVGILPQNTKLHGVNPEDLDLNHRHCENLITRISCLQFTPSAKIHFNIMFHLRLGLPNSLLPSRFPTENLYSLFISLSCVLYAPRISSFVNLSP
jgi:hypothetical protein